MDVLHLLGALLQVPCFWLCFWQLKPKLILTEKLDFLEMEISNYTSYFLEARQPTQATTIENLKYETSCRNAKLLINHTECIEYSMYLMPHYHLEPLSTRMCPSFEHKYSCGSLLKKLL